MPTVLDVVTAALQNIGVLQGNEAPGGDDGALALNRLNQLLSSWNNPTTLVKRVKVLSVTLTSGDNSYTIGATGDFVYHRPIRVRKAVLVEAGTTPARRHPVRVLTREQYADIATRDDTGGSLVTAIWIDEDFPNATLRTYPKPGAAHQLEIHTEDEWAAFSALSDAFTAPDGWERAVGWKLAEELALPFGVVWSPQHDKLAREAMAHVQQPRQKSPRIRTDNDLVSRSGITHDQFLAGGFLA